MNKVIITTDSGIDPIKTDTMIPIQIVDSKKNIGYRDTIDINVSKILEDTQKGIYYKTSAPLYDDYYDMFTKYLKEGYDVVHLSLGSKISSTSVSLSNQIANDLNEEYENKVYSIDSMTGATGGTLLYLLANKILESGANALELVSEIEKIKPYIKTSFYVPNPMGFIRSGRNSHTLDLAEKAINALKLKFRVDFDKTGGLVKKDIYRGTDIKSFYKMLNDILKESDDIDKSNVVIGTVKEDKINMHALTKFLESFDMNVTRQDINGCVAAYGSADLIGFSYVLKK